MPHVALVTARAARDLDEDLPPLVAALGETHAQLSVVDWDDASSGLVGFDVAVLRSTWDYTQRLPEFLGWAARAATNDDAAESDRRRALEYRQALPRASCRRRRAGCAELVRRTGRVRARRNGCFPRRARSANSWSSPASAPARAMRSATAREERDAGNRACATPARREAQRAAAAVSEPRRRARRDRADVFRRRVQPRDPQGTAAPARRRSDARAVRGRAHHAAHAERATNSRSRGARSRRSRSRSRCCTRAWT